mgnify:CR=1 FL=1
MLNRSNNPLQQQEDAAVQQGLGEPRSVSRVALLGHDYHGIRFELLCEEGDSVTAGSVLMRDARRQSIVFTAAVAGRVVKIERGSKRKLLSLQIETDVKLGSTQHTPPNNMDRDSLRNFMLASGVWCALRTRPFGNIPDPDGEPSAILITAIDDPLQAPAPEPIIDAYAAYFRSAVAALARISATPLYVCHANGWTPPVDQSANLQCAAFKPGNRAHLPGVHINSLCPLGLNGGEVWHIGYQEVISLGMLLLDGVPWGARVISVSGSAVAQPHCIIVPPGASLEELANSESPRASPRIYSSSSAPINSPGSTDAFLRAGHHQVKLMTANLARSVGHRAGVGVIIPSDKLDALAPPGIYAVPLMRALQVGDIDRARELGALELVEEDLAALSNACLSQADYGALLRDVLNQLEAAG